MLSIRIGKRRICATCDYDEETVKDLKTDKIGYGELSNAYADIKVKAPPAPKDSHQHKIHKASWVEIKEDK